jgi:hypothetical protein
MQSLAKQKHALTISEHTLIIMCNNKTGYNWYSKMSKRTFSVQYPRKFVGGQRQTLIRGPVWLHLLTLWLKGPGAFAPGKFLKSVLPEMAKFLHSGSLVDSYIYVYFTVILYLPPPFNWGPRAKRPPLGGLESTYNYLWQHSFIIKWEYKYFRLGKWKGA